MRKKHVNWFKVLTIIPLLMLIAHSKATPYRKSDDTRKNLFPLSIIHINDFHARFEETNSHSLECKRETNDTCIGGYARIVSVVKRLQKTRTNPIYLNAGDNFAGTIWYTFGKWNVTQYFLNMLNADVMTVGNHEFDHGPEEVALFLDAIESPNVLANVDLSDEPILWDKFLNSTVLVRGGRKIGIIGIIKSDINTISKTRNIKFLDEIETVRRESEKLEKDGVDIIVVLSHSGVDVDLKIAQEAGSKIDVIVGGHTHTFMYTGHQPGPDKPSYDYPAVVEQTNGHKVLVVQASSFAKYVGDLTVYFNEIGEAVRWTGQPIFLGPDVQPDPYILRELKPWKKEFHVISRQVISATDVALDNDNCRYAECTMGLVIADAFLNSYRISRNNRQDNEDEISVAFIQAGGVRASIPEGQITFGDILTIMPFENRVDSFDLLGEHLWEAMEKSVTAVDDVDTIIDIMLQISGMKIVVNASQPIGNRLISIHTICEKCTPVQYMPIDLERNYRIITTDFLANGGNGFTVFEMHKQNYEFGVVDNEALTSYFKVIPKLENVETGRIIVLN